MKYEKLLESTLYFKVFREILKGNDNYRDIINRLKISVPAISEALKALEEARIINRSYKGLDKRFAKIVVNENEFTNIYQEWIINISANSQLELGFKTMSANLAWDPTLTEKLITFSKKYADVIFIKNIESLFIAFQFNKMVK